MKNFRVTVAYKQSVDINIKANNREEAMDATENMLLENNWEFPSDGCIVRSSIYIDEIDEIK